MTNKGLSTLTKNNYKDCDELFYGLKDYYNLSYMPSYYGKSLAGRFFATKVYIFSGCQNNILVDSHDDRLSALFT